MPGPAECDVVLCRILLLSADYCSYLQVFRAAVSCKAAGAEGAEARCCKAHRGLGGPATRWGQMPTHRHQFIVTAWASGEGEREQEREIETKHLLIPS